MSIKTALCVKVADFLALNEQNKTIVNSMVVVDENGNNIVTNVYQGQGPLVLETTLEDRATCESDDSLLQLLPYIQLIDRETRKVFGYFRAAGGGETKLFGKMSIGVGGHVEDVPVSKDLLVKVLTEHAVREVVEEVDYKDPQSIRAQIEAQLEAGVPMVYQPEDKVGKFHLGLMLSVMVDKILIGQLEHNVIERGQWFDLPRPTLAEGDFFEPWSLALIELTRQSMEQPQAAEEA